MKDESIWSIGFYIAVVLLLETAKKRCDASDAMLGSGHHRIAIHMIATLYAFYHTFSSLTIIFPWKKYDGESF